MTGKAYLFPTLPSKNSKFNIYFPKIIIFAKWKCFLSGARSYFVTLHSHLVLASETSICNQLSIIVCIITSPVKTNKKTLLLPREIEDFPFLVVLKAKLDEPWATLTSGRCSCPWQGC